MNSTCATGLPPEIWGNIFANLSLRDRYSVRLTCRCFYMACDTPRAPEKIVCNDFNTGALVQTWSHAGRKLRKLTLNGAYLMNDSILEIFKIHGPFIKSLTLRKCELAPGLFKQIIEYCNSLRSISLLRIPTQKNLFDDFLALERNGVVREDVTDFTFSQKNEANFSNSKFLQFFTIFPNICKLEMKIRVDAHFNELSTSSTDITSDAIFSFSCIHDQLWRMRNRLEDLSLFLIYNLGDDYVSLQNFKQIFQIQMPNLTKLSLNWIDLWIDLWDPPTNQILPFKTLTRFHCVFGEAIWRSHYPSAFVELLLNTATGLHTLKIDFIKEIGYFYMESDCFVSLVKSQLRNLDMHFLDSETSLVELRVDFEPWWSSSTEVTLAPNNVLKCLIVTLDDFNFDVFTTYFKSLEYVFVGINYLHTVVKFQTQWKSLCISNSNAAQFDPEAEQQWLHQEYPSRTFNQLTHLQIFEYDHLDLATIFLSGFEFPELKSLTIKPLSWSWPGNDFISILKNITALHKLEYLEIGSRSLLPAPDALAMCRALPKLRYFVVVTNKDDPLDNYDYAEFFIYCPSLLIFVHKFLYQDKYVIYVRDQSTNNILNVSSSDCASMYKIPKEYHTYRY